MSWGEVRWCVNSWKIFPRSCNWTCTLKNPCCGGWKISVWRLLLINLLDNSTYTWYTERTKTRREARKVPMIRILNVNSAPLIFIYNWKSPNKYRCAPANAGKTLCESSNGPEHPLRLFLLINERRQSKNFHCAIGNLFWIFFIMPLPIHVRCKTKAAAGAVCAIEY